MGKSNKINLYRLLISLVLIGSINWGSVGLFNYDLVKNFGSLFGYNAGNYISTFIYLLVATSAIVLMFQRDTFLPFLGHTVMPKPMTEYNPSGENVITKTIENLPPNVKVIYWAALPSNKTIDNPDDAYGEYTNQGVTTTDANGVAILKVQKPTDYIVPCKGKLESHIHYRYWKSPGMASSLFTIQV
jgi:uncharacterized membrane protein YuzA (DUF378 family)